MTRDHGNGTTLGVPLRWSSVRDCSRKAVYEATNQPRRERTEREERILYRGKSLGREYASFLTQKYGPDNVKTEIAVKWPFGIGHMDIYLVPTKTAIEVLSSAHASDSMMHSKLLQLVGYMEFSDSDVTPVAAGALVVLNPSDFTDEIFPVAKTSKAYAGFVEEMYDRIAQVRNWAESGIVPERVCAKPNDAIGHFCLHAEHCFQDWEAPVLPDLTDDTTRDLVTQLYRAKQGEREYKAALAIAETERKEIEQRLDDLVPVGKWTVGSLEVTRIHIDRKPTLDLKKAELAGYPVETLAEYMKPGASYDTFRVDRVSDAPLEDFGDEAPWTDADLRGEAA